MKNNNLKTVLTLESNSDVVSYIEELYPYLTGVMLGYGWKSPGDFYQFHHRTPHLKERSE